MQNAATNFILIDDSRLDCFISEKIIKNIDSSHRVLSFSEAAVALQHIESTPLNEKNNLTVILLDIQMPVMNGFDFAEAFEKLPSEQKANYAIFMVSSSTNESDRIRIGNFPSIRHLYKKPLNKEVIHGLIEKIHQY
jgi:CheY-like chemotaxis protein